MDKFLKLNETEYLEIDKVLFASNYPILFTCVNSQRDLYICVCSQNNEKGKKWLLTRTTPGLVIDMLSDRIAIRDVFLRFPDSRISIIADECGIRMKRNDKDDWKDNSVYLPKAGEYMEAEDGEFDEEILYFSQMDKKYYQDQFFQTKAQYKSYAGKDIEMLISIPENGSTKIIGHILVEILNTTVNLRWANLRWENYQTKLSHYIENIETVKKVKIELGDLNQEVGIEISKDDGILNAA